MAINADAAPPVIQDILPRGIAAGGTRAIEIRGTELGEITEVWTSFPTELKSEPVGNTAATDAETAEPTPTDPSRYRCELTLAADQPVGVGALRVATKDGVSQMALIFTFQEHYAPNHM